MLHPSLSAFRKGFRCQTALLKIIEDWKKALDEKIKRMGSKIEPCGTPLYTVSKELHIFFYLYTLFSTRHIAV
jgi:hypothetical protein